jgi:hypothetical protein
MQGVCPYAVFTKSALRAARPSLTLFVNTAYGHVVLVQSLTFCSHRLEFWG